MELYFTTLLLSSLLTVVHGVDFDPDPNKWIQGQHGSFSCSHGVSVIVKKNGKEEATCTTDGSNFCIKPAPSYAKTFTTGNTLNFTILTLDRTRDTANWECSGVTTYIDVKTNVSSVTIINKDDFIFTDGQATTINCTTGVSYPHANITWSITGGTTTNNSDGTTTSILQYTANKTDHNKILQCSAYNGYGSTISNSTTLNITFLPVVHIQPVSNLSIIEGDELKLTCVVVEANPPASSYTWSKDGVTIPGQQTSMTLITSVQRSDEGIYTCTATNSVGPGKSAGVQVNVGVPVSTVTIINKTGLIFTDGQATTINCTTGVSYPHANIMWFIDGKNITGGTTTNNNTDGTTTSILQHTANKTDHKKILQCRAYNGYGLTISTSITLNIRSAPSITDENMNVSKLCVPAVVIVEAYPRPTCKWITDGGVSNGIVSTKSVGNLHTCTLSTDSTIQTGKFNVNISNELGFTSHNITVPKSRDPFPFYLLIVQVIHIIAVFLIILVIRFSDQGATFTIIVSVVIEVLIVVCIGILIYMLVDLREVFWIIVSSVMIVFCILTAVVPILYYRLFFKQGKNEYGKHMSLGLKVLCVIIILFSVGDLIYMITILTGFDDVCGEDLLGAAVGVQAVDVILLVAQLIIVFKMKEEQ